MRRPSFWALRSAGPSRNRDDGAERREDRIRQGRRRDSVPASGARQTCDCPRRMATTRSSRAGWFATRPGWRTSGRWRRRVRSPLRFRRDSTSRPRPTRRKRGIRQQGRVTRRARARALRECVEITGGGKTEPPDLCESPHDCARSVSRSSETRCAAVRASGGIGAISWNDDEDDCEVEGLVKV